MNAPARSLPFRLIDNLRQEAQDFRQAIAEAPAPELRWDLLGMRSFAHRLWWRLMREHTEPFRLGIAVFVGVLIGCSPFFGFHVALAVVLSLAFRLNKLAVWAATNVSLPIFAPVLAFLGIQAGHLVLHGVAAPIRPGDLIDIGLSSLFVDWVVGFWFVGVPLGLALGGLCWQVARKRRS